MRLIGGFSSSALCSKSLRTLWKVGRRKVERKKKRMTSDKLKYSGRGRMREASKEGEGRSKGKEENETGRGTLGAQGGKLLAALALYRALAFRSTDTCI